MSPTSAVTLATLAATLLLSSVAAQSAVTDAQLLQPLDATNQPVDISQLPLPVLPDGWLDVQNVSTSGDALRSPSHSDADVDVLPVPPYNGSLMLRHRRELGDMGGWQDGRCTWYGGPGGPGPDGMNIFAGSCGYGSKLKAPYFVAAAQTMGGYDWGLTGDCGKCFEVMCVDGRTRGTSQSQLGPWEGCQESGKRSVVIMISDSCPCNHPNPSNKKWCCGDQKHFDLSYSAFDVIARRDKGVVDLKIRPVSCDLAGQTIYYGTNQGPAKSPPPPYNSGR